MPGLFPNPVRRVRVQHVADDPQAGEAAVELSGARGVGVAAGDARPLEGVGVRGDVGAEHEPVDDLGLAIAQLVGCEACTQLTLLEAFQFLEERDLPTSGSSYASIQRPEGCRRRWGEEFCSGCGRLCDRAARVFDFQGDAQGMCAHGRGTRALDLVDVLRMGRGGELDRGDARVKDRDPVVTVGRESDLFGHAERVTVEPDRLVEVVGLDDQTELLRWRGRRHVTHLRC